MYYPQYDIKERYPAGETVVFAKVNGIARKW